MAVEIFGDPGSTALSTQNALRDRLQGLLGNPDLYPQEFKSWLSLFLANNPNLKMTQVQLPTVNGITFVGAGGVAVNFSGTWVNLSGGFQAAGYFIDPWRMVHLCGTVKSGIAGTEIFALPAGFRPQARIAFSVPTNSGTGEVDVTGLGSVVHVAGGTSAVSLDGIHYRQYT